MITGCIYNIDLKMNNNDIISVSSDEFNHFYLANIDEDGEEIQYEKLDNEKLYANFFMLKLLNNDKNATIINKLYKEKNIVGVGLSFTNGKYQEFNLAKKRIVKDGLLENFYEHNFKSDKNLCVLVTDKKIKYTELLFY